MALSIKDQQTDELARRVAEVTGESLTAAIRTSLRERLERLELASGDELAAELSDIAARCAALPVIDARDPDQILGYDERGLPA